ncbi:hypothetical protein [Halopiger aswanensis]|uniref:Uncharacterized protein n=1 Tax=Halopiger aswanensis TaxID=148449 RepID=A0A3R7EG71_9EURY|nr:hypothetical protein [Halopiger aswanensis]RKD95939.1 hypothetical protein ATJ93_2802 [Halopiger aswanensis]
MDKERVPRWGWLLIGLFAASIVAQLLNVILGQAGLAEEYQVVTVIATMAPVLIYVGVWYDDHRQHYWEYSSARIVGDIAFVLLGAIIGATTVIAVLSGFEIPRYLQDILAMGGGFLVAWLLFWWRNPDLYRFEDE